MVHHQCCSKEKVKRGLWSPEEDEKLVSHITAHGHGCWSSVPKLAGLERCGKSCRLRWINYLRPDVKRGCFTEEEEMTIIDVHRILGNRWSQIAKHLPGRTDNEVKNFWNSCIKKKLLSQGLDPTTHNLLSSSSSSNNIITNSASTFSVHQYSPSTKNLRSTPTILNNNDDHLIINDPASSSTTLSGLVLINNSTQTTTTTATAAAPIMMFSSPSSTCRFTTSSSLLNHHPYNFNNIINFNHYSGVDPFPILDDQQSQHTLQHQHRQISSCGLLYYNHHDDDHDQLSILLNSSGIIHHDYQQPDYHQPNTNIHETFHGSITSHFADFDFVDSAFILPPPLYTTTTATTTHIDDDQRLAWDC
ncbi:hypothetical protein ABFS83_13G193000 [Erythranthe nasuta]